MTLGMRGCGKAPRSTAALHVSASQSEMAEKDASARLRRAVKENNLFLVKRIIQRTDMRNSDPGPKRYTSLAWAAVLLHEETFEFLLTSGHDDHELSRDSENNCILMLLADQKPSSSNLDHSDSMRAILRMARLYYDRYPKTLNWQNIHGKTALHFASQKGNEELVRMLCDLGADYNLTDNKGNTPLHYASSWGHIGVVQLLIERGCLYNAHNNDGFTPSDYAYSFNTKDTLQDTARLQYENKKNSRKNIYASKASERAATPTPPIAITPLPRDRDFRLQLPRTRSGSGTTSTSDSGELDSNGLTPGPHSSHSVASSPSQPSASSMSHYHSSHSGNLSQSSMAPYQSSLNNSALSSLANRVRERDADAIEKYRNRSESQGTSSTENRSQNGSYISANGDDSSSVNGLGSTTPKRLRPSISASQLRSTSPIPSPQPSAEVRSRSGTHPTSPLAGPTPVLTRSTSVSVTSPSPDLETYTGPPSQYAQFPEPPVLEEGTSTMASRRMAFHPSTKHPHLEALSAAAHRRGMSAASVRP